MFTCIKPIILASASPRRKRLLNNFGITFKQCAAAIQETPFAGEQAQTFAQRMALEKACAVADKYPSSFVLAADTVVTIDGIIIGKPATTQQALKILQDLQGRTHTVITGVSLICRKENCEEVFMQTTDITFAQFSVAVLKAYIQTGEPMDKAGGYGLQGKGAFLVKQITGSCTNAIGLPVHDCITMLLAKKVIAVKSKQ